MKLSREHFQTLITLFSKFPGIGSRQAERFVYFLARSDALFITQLQNGIATFTKNVKQCPSCYIYHDGENASCEICTSDSRSQETLVVIEKDVDQSSLEDAGVTTGRYFVLGGLLPIASPVPPFIRLAQLKEKVTREKPKEIVLAFSAHPDANHTAIFLIQTMKEVAPKITVTILGRGLSTGSELEYVDQTTLKNAFRNRRDTTVEL